MKYLIIAEKPSVATDLSKALKEELGPFEKKGKSKDNQHFESGKAFITSAVGHLVELKMPTGNNGKKLPWNFNVLPAIPENFDLQPIEKTQARLKHVLALCRKKEFDCIVNACDAGREGELIFRYIMEIGGIQKPIKRLWMQSMTADSIKESWSMLRDDESLKSLSDAAKCRSESDWLVGLNSTRALTCFRSRHGGFNITAAGRVQTPTLAILAERENAISEFHSEKFYEIEADFSIQSGNYLGKWYDPQFEKSDNNKHLKADRLWDKETAVKIVERCIGKSGVIEEEKKVVKQIAPQLYDLTTLQREAPFTAKNTLSIAQSLYERHKMITYPRTDTRYLPEDYLNQVLNCFTSISKSNSSVASFAQKAIKENRLVFNKRIFDNKKISDHFAIIPTGRFVKLSDVEQKLFDMILKRFIAVFFEHAQFEETVRKTTISSDLSQDHFITKGKLLIHPGWLAVYGRQIGVAENKGELTPLNEGEMAQVKRIEAIDKETLPPARYTESTLLSAMEGAGKTLEDEEMRSAMSERGLGTPATRAAIIEGLLRQKYINREGRELNVTGKGLRLIELCEEMDLRSLTSASMTGDWEAKLNRIEKGSYSRQDFMNEISDFTKEVVSKAKIHMEKMVNMVFPDLETECPSCGANRLKQTDKTYECRELECNFSISKYIAGRQLSTEEAIQLLQNKLLPELDGFISRFNKPFSAGLKLTQTEIKNQKKGKWKTEFVFDDEEDNMEPLKEEECVGTITLPDGSESKIYETSKNFCLPDLKTSSAPEGFKLGKTILQFELNLNIVKLLLSTGKSELINGFISKRTKRPFKAHLTFDQKNGKIGFEFPPKANKKK
ncbi:MAG: DNA topoisomerase III [Coraliomargaritaceae bacterium]